MKPTHRTSLRSASAVAAATLVLGLATADIGEAQVPPLDTIFSAIGGFEEDLGSSAACLANFLGNAEQTIVVGATGAGDNLDSSVRLFDRTGTVQFSNTHTPGTLNFLGRSIAAVGDISSPGDDIDDFIVSFDSAPSPSNPSQARVYLGPTGVFDDFSTSFSTIIDVGFTVAGLFGDTDSDGAPDFIVSGVNGTSVSPRITISDLNNIATGPIREIVSNEVFDQFGFAVASISDVNGNGSREIIVGAPDSTSSAGRLYMFDSQTGAQLTSLIGTISGGRLGAAIAEVGDVTNDGISEFIVGAPASPASGAGPGRAILMSPVFSAGAATFTALCTVSGAFDSDEVGFSVGAPGDVNNDGVRDFVVGDPGADNGTGKVTVYSYNGNTCLPLYEMTGTTTNERFGRSISGAPSPNIQCDLNNDGGADFAVGSQRGSEGGITAFAGATPTPTPTPIPTSTPTSAPTATPTVTPSPTSSPPSTQGVVPSKSSFTYKLTPDGDLLAVVTHDVAPALSTPAPTTPALTSRSQAAASPCTASLYGRRTRADRSQPGPINVHVRNKAFTDKTVRFRTSGLRKAQCDFGGKPFSYHMIIKTTCNGESFFSNVVARRTNCGKEPPLRIDRWERQLSNIR